MDTILNLIRIAGDYVSEEVWYRVIQIVINREDVQGYAAKTVFEVTFLSNKTVKSNSNHDDDDDDDKNDDGDYDDDDDP